MTDCIFCKIINKQIPATIIYEDDFVIAFDDIAPKAPIHKIIIPREHIKTINDLEPKHNELIGHMMQVAKKLAKQYGIEESGYRVLTNCNRDGGQMVFHLHMHLLGGRSLTWPPG
jgi:histidine triad (HIT) family protein